MDRLSVELLINIFIYCAHTSAITPLTLGRVCRRWRTVVDSCPRLFQLVVLDDCSHSLYTSNHVAQACLERTKKLDFDVDIHIASRDSILPILSPFLSSLHRWRSFRLSGARSERIKFEHFWHKSDGDPKLEQLNINVVDPGEIDNVADELLHSDSDGSKGATFRPYTISLNSNLLSMHVLTSRLPAPELLKPLRFVALFISEGSMTVNIHPAELLQFLTACPELEYLSFIGLMAEVKFTEEDLQHPPPFAHLPCLRSLVLHSTLSTRVILSHLHTPSLRELHLEHLNVDFQFPVHNPYLFRWSGSIPPPGTSLDTHHPDSFTSMLFRDKLHNKLSYEFEDGDGDDNLSDYSQSPWSDHATGMGLRSLILRSDPPLRVLEMDHADMRSKDFFWLFQHAPELEDLRIVASDMADRVISMLAPRLARRTHESPMLSHTMAVEGDGRQYVQVLMLPRLKSLELYNCQRLSGTAIVQAISQRAAMTDALAQKGLGDYSPLEDVAVAQCSQFDISHGVELATVLGERLRLY